MMTFIRSLFPRRSQLWYRPVESAIPQLWSFVMCEWGGETLRNALWFNILGDVPSKRVAKTTALIPRMQRNAFTTKNLRSTRREASRSDSRTKERFTQLVTS